MRVRLDPSRTEVEALKRAADWRLKRVLDLGCADGRLTLRLAGLGALVHGIDPDGKLIREARRGLPRRFAGRVHFSVGDAQALRHPDGTFDAVVFSWSL
jgi:2-polyprenyl-3-methyl-5-hydroxy-6-metoxy-1,4-benzoquinol methylase